MREFTQNLIVLLLLFAIPYGVSGQCDNSCDVLLGNNKGFIPSGTYTGDDIVEGASSPTLTGSTFDLLNASTSACALDPDGTVDFTFDFEIEDFYDVYGGNIIETSLTGSDAQRYVRHVTSGFQGRNATNDTGDVETSTGDVSCYNMSVCFATPQEAQDVNVDMTSINTNGESFESASLIFLNTSCIPYGTATYNGFWDGTPQGSAGGTNTTLVHAEADMYTIMGTGVFIAADPSVIDVATDPFNPVGTSAGLNDSPTVSADGPFSIGGTNAGLNPTDLVGGFTFRVCLEDVAITATVDEETTTDTGFTSTLNSFSVCRDLCPSGLATTTAPVATVTSESTCQADGTLGGGVTAAPVATCPTGSTLYYSLDAFATPGTTTLPTYDQDNSITITTRCDCDNDATVVSLVATAMTDPGSCCPDGIDDVANVPKLVITTESQCDVPGGTHYGGVISAPATDCPDGSSVQYSTDGTTWGTTLPTYLQGEATTVYTRCLCDLDNTIASPACPVTTDPGECPECIIPEIIAVAVCTGPDGEASEGEYYIGINITDLGSDFDSDDEVTYSDGTTTNTVSATGIYYLGPYSHSGTGTAYQTITFSNDGEICEGVIHVAETICGLSVDLSGESDGTDDTELHASGPACDCESETDPKAGFILAQVGPGTFDPSLTQMMYVLTDVSGQIIEVNQSGLFTDVCNGDFLVHAYNYLIAHLPSPFPSGDIADFTPDADDCFEICTPVPYSLSCVCGEPMIMVDKDDSTPGDPDTDGDDVQTIPAGGTATFTITITNTGGEDLCDISLTDEMTNAVGSSAVVACAPSFASIDTDSGSVAAGAGDGMLLVGESETFTCTIEGEIEGYINEISVEGIGCFTDMEVSDEDETEVLMDCGITDIVTTIHCNPITDRYCLDVTFESADRSSGLYHIVADGITFGPFYYVSGSSQEQVSLCDPSFDSSDAEGPLPIMVVDGTVPGGATGYLEIASIFPDPSGDPCIEESITIVNNSCEEIDLSGYELYDVISSSSATVLLYTFPSGTVLGPGVSMTLNSSAFGGCTTGVWNTGQDGANILDASGAVVASFAYTTTTQDEAALNSFANVTCPPPADPCSATSSYTEEPCLAPAMVTCPIIESMVINMDICMDDEIEICFDYANLDMVTNQDDDFGISILFFPFGPPAPGLTAYDDPGAFYLTTIPFSTLGPNGQYCYTFNSILGTGSYTIGAILDAASGPFDTPTFPALESCRTSIVQTINVVADPPPPMVMDPDMAVCFQSSVDIEVDLDNSPLWQESFENGPGMNYSTSISEYAISDDYFTSTDGSNIPSADNNFTGQDGSFFFAAQDIDNGGTYSLPVSIDFTGISIAGFTSLSFKGLFAEDDGGGEHWDASDYVDVMVNIDGAGYVTILSFHASNGTNSEPALDTNGDGIGDGPFLTDVFQEFTTAIAGTGNLIDIKIEMSLNSSNEDIAIDNVRLCGTTTNVYNYYSVDPGANPGATPIGTGTSYTYTPTSTDTPQMIWVTCVSPAGCESGANKVIINVVGDYPLACNNKINLSLNSECEAYVTVDMLLEGLDDVPEDMFTIELEDSAGNPVPNPIPERYAGEWVQATITEICSGNSCWGKINIDSKVYPQVDVCDCPAGSTTTADGDCVFTCADAVTLTVTPLNQDCSNFTMHYKDEQISFSKCGFSEYKRKWIADVYLDNQGRQEVIVCEQTYFIKPLELDDVLFPHDNSLECSFDIRDTDPESLMSYFDNVLTKDIKEGAEYAYPHYENSEGEFLPIRPGSVHCNISVQYTDVNVEKGCARSTKTYRQWSILDWCNDEVKEAQQIIIIEDTEGPFVDEIAEPEVIAIDPWICYANYVVRDLGLKAEDACSDFTWIVKGGGITYAIGDTIKYLDKGGHLFQYCAVDECGNQTCIDLDVHVKDNTPPTAVCHDELHLSLTADQLNDGDGVAKMFAESFNVGSHDGGCGRVYFKVIREDGLKGSENGFWNNDGPAGAPDFTAPPDPNFLAPCGAADADDFPDVTRFDKVGDKEFIFTGPQVFFDDHVKFCCADIGKDVTVVLRIYDFNPGYGPVDPRRMEHSSYGGITGFDVVENDLFGRFTDCRVVVKVEAKAAPLIVCAPDVTVDCEDSLSDMDALGIPSVNSICGDEPLVYEDEASLSQSCMDGTITRHWYIDYDGDGVVSSGDSHACTQNIHVGGSVFDPATIRWPRHYTGGIVPGWNREKNSDGDCVETTKNVAMGSSIECLEGADLCEPEWTVPYCGLIASSAVLDTLASSGDGSCYKIIKRWTVIDWCKWVPNSDDVDADSHGEEFEAVEDWCLADDSCYADGHAYFRYKRTSTGTAVEKDGYYTFDQVIKVVDNNAPVLAPTTIDTVKTSVCRTKINISKSAENTGCSSNLRWDIKVKNADDVQVAAGVGFGEDITYTTTSLPTGRYSVHYTVFDGCNNSDTGQDTVMLMNSTAPTPYCIQFVSTTFMSESGTVTIWAKDFNQKSTDDCTSDEDLRFSFSGEEYQPSLTFTCDGTSDGTLTFSNGRQQLYNLDMWVWDEDDNRSSCSINLFIDDHLDACPDTGEGSAMISGEVYTEYGDMVEDVMVSLNGAAMTSAKQQMTEEEGLYAFADNYTANDYMVEAHKDGDDINGVTTLDLVLIQKHVLDIENLDSPYKRIAADIDNSGHISAVDIVQLRKLILEIDTAYPNNESWRFVPVNYEFADPEHPFPFEEMIMVEDLDVDQYDEDFIGIKIGDVSGDARTNATRSIEVRSNGVLKLVAKEQTLQKGEIVTVEIQAQNFDEVYGAQFTMEHRGLSFLGAEAGALQVTDANIGQHDDELTFSWHHTKGQTSDEILFSLQFVADQDVTLSQQLRLSSDLTPSEAYVGSGLEHFDVQLEVRDDAAGDYTFELLQNEPNPFDELTLIGFTLPKAGHAELTVFDSAGKVVMSKKGSYAKGYHEIGITEKELAGKGMYFYQLTSGEYTAGKKMILLK